MGFWRTFVMCTHNVRIILTQIVHCIFCVECIQVALCQLSFRCTCVLCGCARFGELLYFNVELPSIHHSNFNYIIQMGLHHIEQKKLQQYQPQWAFRYIQLQILEYLIIRTDWIAALLLAFNRNIHIYSFSLHPHQNKGSHIFREVFRLFAPTMFFPAQY